MHESILDISESNPNHLTITTSYIIEFYDIDHRTTGWTTRRNLKSYWILFESATDQYNVTIIKSLN